MTTPGRHRPLRIGIVTVSDRASRGIYEDKGGPAIRAELETIVTSPWEPVVRVMVEAQDAALAQEGAQQLAQAIQAG